MTRTQGIAEIVSRQRRFFGSGATLPCEVRLERLRRLLDAIAKHEDVLHAALAKDLCKPPFESYLTETGFSRYDLRHTIKRLKKWMKPKRVRTPLLAQPGRSWILYCPLGVNLIVSPFNYPIQLAIVPLTAAIAAGNTAVVKTSELTPACSEATRQLIEEVFDPEYAACVTGGVEESTALLNQKFDHIFFTGSPRVGAIVMRAAAEHLTPVTLELGGKSPCIVHHDAKMSVAANRIAFAKFLNAGQTCVTPDYVMVHRRVERQFIDCLKQRISEMYGPDPAASGDFARIVNAEHCRRIASLIDPAKVVIGGQYNIEKRFIAPTVMSGVTVDDKVMSEEIFGPVLPVMTYDELDEVYETIAGLPQHPLAFYVFSESKTVQQELIQRIPFGGGCINHCMQHLVNPNLPFGGVGQSGIGSYHGFSGFERFSHKKSILKAATRFDLSLVYPPYQGKLARVRRIMK
ncbi:MAG: aldehyde dehydrogenase [Sedimentisphaerales bacterium]|jgi:aldehyde dehydrogenase (NAD+)|nr:aldehyde dehydrogenase [Sedimentisphaerales bacterium]HNY77190.1 aldehyde dehydrogenase [Sedimentisphaerales bacterium]HOC62394.1 aldehyde dehydrogenase [Sedimentisphaerales bacterium]HOH66585.1 aldehyde dehydrogenase [Sedimentisphaerales bacterium]HPY50171.1 aldehyde dehydrogenase [Sedimentisphaerales bacterium]